MRLLLFLSALLTALAGSGGVARAAQTPSCAAQIAAARLSDQQAAGMISLPIAPRPMLIDVAAAGPMVSARIDPRPDIRDRLRV